MTGPDTRENARIELEGLNIPCTPLRFISFVMAGDLDFVTLFLASGMDVNSCDKNGISALMWAAGKGHDSVVQVLLQNGALVNLQSPKGRTALMSAAYFGKMEPTKMLIAHGAIPELRDAENRNALQWAKARKYAAIAEFLEKLKPPSNLYQNEENS
ncbi:MAG: ankyrin repeat domain-containing protein [Nitrospirae bacterium]|nr:ankyrin repeat domain-containing protein [Nitrospirota bacterium]